MSAPLCYIANIDPLPLTSKVSSLGVYCNMYPLASDTEFHWTYREGYDTILTDNPVGGDEAADSANETSSSIISLQYTSHAIYLVVHIL